MPDVPLTPTSIAALTQDPAADARTAIKSAVTAKLHEAAGVLGVTLPAGGVVPPIPRPRWRKHTLEKGEAGAAMMRTAPDPFAHLQFSAEDLQSDANLVRILEHARQIGEAYVGAVTMHLNEVRSRLFDRTKILGDLVYGITHLNVAGPDKMQLMARIAHDFVRIDEDFARGVQATRNENDQLRAEGVDAVVAAEAEAEALAVENQVLRGGSVKGEAPPLAARRLSRPATTGPGDGNSPRPRRVRIRRAPRR